MTDKTSTQNLTRTRSDDDPKKMDQYLGALAGEVDQRIAGQYRNLARSQRPPAAMIEIRTPVIQSPGGPGTLIYDTVAFDTAGLVDLSQDARVIKLASPGYWCIGAYVRCTGWTNASQSGVSLWLQFGGSNTITNFHDIIGLGDVGCSWSAIESTDATGTLEEAACGVTNVGTFTPPTTTTILYAALWAYKIRDL